MLMPLLHFQEKFFSKEKELILSYITYYFGFNSIFELRILNNTILTISYILQYTINNMHTGKMQFLKTIYLNFSDYLNVFYNVSSTATW